MRLDDLNKVTDMFEGKQGVVELFGDAYKKRANKLSALTESNAELKCATAILVEGTKQTTAEAHGRQYLTLARDWSDDAGFAQCDS
ncbi:hypothetical protein L1A22_25580 [Pseudomonas extremaustralis]|uniref:hypothetical protein n=1 Tax=Pseudomonas extremaustralis TaxID=359110 RepID=UPI0021C99D01|nr:hypothetical protein [Pseudomonas extremaustralis]UUJ40026.1 hypothetical protein L1A22_25580 [Pseudomonas extremaustralis]